MRWGETGCFCTHSVFFPHNRLILKKNILCVLSRMAGYFVPTFWFVHCLQVNCATFCLRKVQVDHLFYRRVRAKPLIQLYFIVLLPALFEFFHHFNPIFYEFSWVPVFIFLSLCCSPKFLAFLLKIFSVFADCQFFRLFVWARIFKSKV